MLWTKTKIAAGATLAVAFVTLGAAAWAMQNQNAGALPAPQVAQVSPQQPAQPPATKPPPDFLKADQPDGDVRIRGIVRDEQGRPMSKAWIGWWVNRRAPTQRTIKDSERGEAPDPTLRWEMTSLHAAFAPADRTDDNGRFDFTFPFTMPGDEAAHVHFASSDFKRER